MSPTVGRAIGVVVLCLLVGLFLTHLGIAARGILTDTWHTILSVGLWSARSSCGRCPTSCSALSSLFRC
jgi:hypothetical protein